MSSTRDVAAGFSITGLLDQSSKIRDRYPVVEIEVSAIADHPANVAYSMDDDGIRKLAAPIAKNGLTDIPLVRKMADGSWQMISEHWRKAAFRSAPARTASPTRGSRRPGSRSCRTSKSPGGTCPTTTFEP